VTKVPSGDVNANVATYLRHHPADSCHIKGSGAICATANPDQVVVIVATGAPSP
jgi:putative NIF3 family GTP cyclohydrolase 1 type 2